MLAGAVVTGAALAVALGGVVVLGRHEATGPDPTWLAATPAAMRLVVHDQQGIAIANQAAAQAPDAPTRAAAAALASAHAARVDLVTRLLDRARVPVAARFAVPVDDPAPPADPSVLRCDLLSDDQVSRLAGAPPERFDVVLGDLVSRHAAGGDVLVGELRVAARLGGADAATLAAARDRVDATSRAVADGQRTG